MKTQSFLLVCLTLTFFSISIGVLQANLNNGLVDSEIQADHLISETMDDLYTIQFSDGTFVTYAVNSQGVHLQKTNATDVETKLQDCNCGLPQAKSLPDGGGSNNHWDCVIIHGRTFCACDCTGN